MSVLDRGNGLMSRTMRHGSLVAFLGVLYQSLYRAVPNNNDILLSLPFVKEFVQPGLYSPHDLLVSSGIRGPFHLYKFVGGMLYAIGANVDIVWEILFLVFLFATFLAIWHLSFELTGSLVASSITVALIAVAHPLRGTLNAAAVPLPAFVTALAAMPVALTALILLLKKKSLPAMAFAGAVFNIHPYVGLLVAFACAVTIVVQEESTLKQRLLMITVGGLLALPNAFYILSNLPSGFIQTSYDFYGQFRLYAFHVFVEDYWLEGYGWFAVNLAAATFFSRFIDEGKRKTVVLLIGSWFALIGIYVLNMYVIKNSTILFMFLFRGTYFIKPLLFAIVTYGALRWWSEQKRMGPVSDSRRFFVLTSAGLWFFSLVLPLKLAVLADLLGLLALSILLRSTMQHRVFTKNLMKLYSYVSVFLLIIWAGAYFILSASERLLVEAILVGVTVVLGISAVVFLWKTNRDHGSSAEQSHDFFPQLQALLAVIIMLVGHHLLISGLNFRIPFVPEFKEIRQRIMMHEPPTSTWNLMKWAKGSTHQGSLFVVPPDEWDKFGAFRLVAERGLYVTIMDVNQLAFDATVYHEAHERLKNLGVQYPSRHQYDTRGYYAMLPTEFSRLQEVDFVVFEKSKLNPAFRLMVPAYSDKLYVVFNTHELGD